MEEILTDKDLEDIRNCILGQIATLRRSEVGQGFPFTVIDFHYEHRICRFNEISVKLDIIKKSRDSVKEN